MAKSWEYEVDIVCVGSGIGGCAAATAAAAEGLRPLIVEKTDKVGGVTAYSGGQLWVPGNHYATESGVHDSIESAVEYIETVAEGWGKRRRLEAPLSSGARPNPSDDAIHRLKSLAPGALKIRVSDEDLVPPPAVGAAYPHRTEGAVRYTTVGVPTFPC